MLFNTLSRQSSTDVARDLTVNTADKIKLGQYVAEKLNADYEII